MKLSNNLDRFLVLMVFVVFSITIGIIYVLAQNKTYAEGEDGFTYIPRDYFVNIYDSGKKLIVKTSSASVNDVLARAGISLGENDRVEPSLDTVVDADNYFINIHRARPVLVIDGKTEKYSMTASYDYKTIVSDAGFTVYDGDEISPVINDKFLELGMAEIYNIKRGGGTTITEEVEIPFGQQTVKDYNIAPGTEEIRQYGEVGVKVLTYNVQYVDGAEAKKQLVSETVKREPVDRIVAIGASAIERSPLTASKGRNRYTVTKSNGVVVERQETYYDLNMSRVMQNASRICGVSSYYGVRGDGVKVDADGYVIVAANLNYYPRCSVVETSLGPGKVYDTGSFAEANPEQFDIATDWTNRNGV